MAQTKPTYNTEQWMLDNQHHRNNENNDPTLPLKTNWPYPDGTSKIKKPPTPKFFIDCQFTGNTFAEFENLKDAVEYLKICPKGTILRPYTPTNEEHDAYLAEKRHQKRLLY